jgi:NAD(P)-dependent dehydrogenase (short-subunit alcohol dehydrogenase family)
MGTAQEVAKVIVFLLSDDASYVTGGEYSFALSNTQHADNRIAHWTVDGGYAACGFYKAG